MAPSAATLTPIVESNGFTLVEEDDVAFTLSLCREIYRIYGTYQDGDLKADESVRTGLLLTVEMFSALRRTVRDGMPGMRIEVAEAQVREMIATLFGELLPARKDRNRARQVGPSARQVGPSVTDLRDRALGTPAGAAAACAPLRELAERSEEPPTVLADPEVPVAPAVEAAPRPRAWKVAAKVVLTLVGSAVAAVLINVPLAVLALFPNELAPIGAGLVVAGVAGSAGYRRWRPAAAR